MIRNKFIYVSLLAIGATLFGSFMGAGVKLLSNDLHPIIICFYRCLMGLIIITYDTILPTNVHNPKSSGDNCLVTIITNIVPVTTPIRDIINPIRPE